MNQTDTFSDGAPGPTSPSAKAIAIQAGMNRAYDPNGVRLASIDDLRSVDVAAITDGTGVIVAAYYRGLAYGGGMFRWKADSTAPDDGGYTIKPAGHDGAGRWKRVTHTPRTVNIVEFGAKPDDETFDNAPAINAAIACLNPYRNRYDDSKTGGDVIIPAGKFWINDTLYGSPNVRLLGTGGVPGFRNSSQGAACICAMRSMTATKVMYDTAPWLNNGTGRYTQTTEMVYGRAESDGYYGAYLENLCFIGTPETQAAVRIWRVPRSQLHNVAVINCKVGFWLNGSWAVTLRDCFSLHHTYQAVLIYQCTAVNFYAGYFTSARTPWRDATRQWFHRAVSASNKANIAFTTGFVYGYNSFDINFYGVTLENNNRDFALFYCANVNLFGGYIEDLAPPETESGHRVLVQCVASRINFNGTYLNCADKPAVVQSGNTGHPNEISQVNFIRPKMTQGLAGITKDLGYGRYNIRVESEHSITTDLADTLIAQRRYTVQFIGLSAEYTMRGPVLKQGKDAFTLTVNHIIAGGEYAIRLLMKNVNVTMQQDIRFTVLVGAVCTITAYQARSTVGTPTLPQPEADFDAASGLLTLTFKGNADYYSLNRIQCVPTEALPLFTY